MLNSCEIVQRVGTHTHTEVESVGKHVERRPLPLQTAAPLLSARRCRSVLGGPTLDPRAAARVEARQQTLRLPCRRPTGQRPRDTLKGI